MAWLWPKRRRARHDGRDAEIRRLEKQLLGKEAELEAANRALEVRDVHIEELYAVIERNRERVNAEHADESRRVGTPVERKQVSRG